VNQIKIYVDEDEGALPSRRRLPSLFHWAAKLLIWHWWHRL